jgi:transposase-like protein
MKCKYCLQTNVVKNGRLSYDQYYKCKDCNRYFRHTLTQLKGLLTFIFTIVDYV